MRRPGHEKCHTCNLCGLGYCPDCDDEGRICLCEGWGNDLVKTPDYNSVDIPLNRPKPKRRKPDRGSSTVEYALLMAMIAAVSLACFTFREQLVFDFGTLTTSVSGQSGEAP